LKERTLQSVVRSNLKSVLVATFVFILAVTSLTPTSSAQSTLQLGRHFIVLIDDSCSISGCLKGTDKRLAIIADLPGRLFGESKGIPAFNPETDRVSVLFFTILNGTRECDVRGPRSVLPENIFDLAYTGKLDGREDFASKLQTWMSDDCHFKGNWSPIVISSLLVLPYIQPRLPAGELHSKTLLIQVTDGEFNSRTTPGHELTDYRRTGEISHVTEADRLLNQVSGLFSLKILPDQQPARGVFYLAAEYSPQRAPETAIQYQRNSFLYPQALSSSELRYRLNDQLLGDIQLLSQGKEAPFDFKPLWLRVGFQNQQGGDWRLGNYTLPQFTEATRPVSLNPCELPQCEANKDNDRMGIKLFEAGVGGPLTVPNSAAEPEPGQIKFRVGFHYNTTIYDHLCVETPELLIKAEPARPTEIPNLFLPSSKLGKAEIANQWIADDDGVTTQEEAKNRILAQRNVNWLLALIGFVILSALVMVFLFLRYYRRAFLPQLIWLARPNVVVDFNQPAPSRMLVGTLRVENNQPVPWLGRLLKNEEQPTRHAEISLKYNYFTQSGLSLAGKHPIGFVRGESAVEAQEELDRSTVETVSDGREIYVFLAAEKIDDYVFSNGAVSGDTNDAHFTIPLTAQMNWKTQHAALAGRGSWINEGFRWLTTRVASERPGSVSEDVECSLTVKPEEPRKPIVTFTRVKSPKLYFKKDSLVQVGSFWFESQSDHEFAEPYRWEGYTIQTYQGNRPLAGQPIRLKEPAVRVDPRSKLEVPVYTYCDNLTIPNPDPLYCEYTFKLIGDYSAESQPGPYQTILYRDPTRAEIELRLIQPKRQLEVYWTTSGTAKLRTVLDGADADEFLTDTDTILLDPQMVRFDARTTTPRELVSFEIGNSGAVGRGLVEVEMTTSIQCDQSARNSIQMDSDQPLEALLGVYDFNTPLAIAVIKEGEPVQRRAVRFQPNLILRIVSARIQADRFAAEIKLAIRVVDDQGGQIRRALTVRIPINLEQLPGRNWLAIDFGTSAISAALGAGRDEGVAMIQLQDIKVPGGRSFAQYDTENSERKNRQLLPSWICCNSDLRAETGDRQRPGFPGYYSEHLSMTPGEPDYIGLPAVTHEFEEYPGRIIYSLKSWLGKASRSISIQVKENGKDVQKALPLEKMVESGFAALAEAYLFEPTYRADQIVISHPNTFTRRHQDLLHRIAYSALGKPNRFGIPLPERVRLISESDAVAYHYCTEQMRAQPRAGTERILVYDFGAGTLDLSLVKIVWKQEPPRHPIHWQVEKRLGVPVAGNYIDEIIARLIHSLLSDSSLVEANGFRYRFPIVGRPPLDQEAPFEHRRAIIRLWNWIREGKHEWSQVSQESFAQSGSFDDLPPLKIKVGSTGRLEVVIPAKGLEMVNKDRSPDKPCLWVDETGYIYLSIPTSLIYGDKRMTEFLDFVTGEIISEVLDSAGIVAKEVDTVIVPAGERFFRICVKGFGGISQVLSIPTCSTTTQ
jgi:hypothetical protein